MIMVKVMIKTNNNKVNENDGNNNEGSIDTYDEENGEGGDHGGQDTSATEN